MTSASGEATQKLKEINETIQRDFKYDPNLLFVDTFERISSNLNQIFNLIKELNNDEQNYWIIYNMCITVLPICERLIFAGYSDHILELLLNIYREVSSNLIFITSRYVPLRMKFFSIICLAFANTQETREKDAETFITTFKNEMIGYKQLEEQNVSGLSEQITVCTGETMTYEQLYASVFNIIELISVHFTASEDLNLDNSNSTHRQDKKAPKAQKGKGKDETPPQQIVLPNKRVVELISNSYSSKGSKNDFATKYSQLPQSWMNPDCNFGPALLHRILFAFLKSKAQIDSIEGLKETFPDDPVINTAMALKNNDWAEIGNILYKLTKSDIQEDLVFYNSLASQLWRKYSKGEITDVLPLRGALKIFVNSPSPCPMQVSLIALKLAWYFDSQKDYDQAMQVSEDALSVIENFRDIFAIRKSEKIISSNKIPCKPLDNNFILFEKWLECLHVDVLTILFRSKLSFGLEMESETAKQDFANEIEEMKKEREKTRELYGKLSLKQQQHYDETITRQFKPPNHSEGVENELLERFKSNNMAKAILYIQMSFFRPSKAGVFLEKARNCLNDAIKQEISFASPIVYINRNEAAFVYTGNQQNAKTIALYGKESNNATSFGLTLANTALQGTGIKQDKIEPLIVTNLKPNYSYTFGFAAYDANDEIIDTITDIFTCTTCHHLSTELIWSYIASAAFQLKDNISFDQSLSTLLTTFSDVPQNSDEALFFKNSNPFNRFYLKPFTFNSPAPLLQAFSTALIMAARLFSNKPLHATAFHKIALELSQVLGNQQLTLQICYEMFTILQPILVNSYHARWVIHPLLFIITALKSNKSTQKDQVHQDIISRASFALDNAFVNLYQEKQLSVFVMNSIIEMPPNPMRSSFIMFASRYHLLENSIQDSSLPLAAADLFRQSAEKSHDDLFAKYKQDPGYLCSAAYLVANAHNDGLLAQGISWSNTALEHAKTLLDDDKKDKKGKAKEQTKAKQAKKPVKKDKNASTQGSSEDVASVAAASKIQSCWMKYNNLMKNLKKFNDANKYRCALNMLNAMCMIEQESSTTSTSTAATTERGKKSKSKPKKEKDQKNQENEETKEQINDNSIQIITMLLRAIVLAQRCGETTVIRSSINVLTDFARKLNQGCGALSGEKPFLDMATHILIQIIPLEEQTSQTLVRELFLCLLRGNINVTQHLIDSSLLNAQCTNNLWMINSKELPEELANAQTVIQRREPAENIYYQASDLLDKIQTKLLNENDVNNAIKTVGDLAIGLQHKQRLSMSCTLLRRLAFILFEMGDKEQATSRLNEALECHFRTIRVYEKVDQIIQEDTEEKFYQKHSWSGCLSIFATCSLLAMNSDRNRAMLYSKLASHAISSLFAGCPLNPTKSIDFACYEPSEIIPGIDIFSSLDANQRLLLPVPADYMTIAITNHLSSLLSYEMHFEMFKPLSFARHYFRFISRNPQLLARTRITSAIICAEFGLQKSAIEIMSDVATNFGATRRTKEYIPTPTTLKRFEFSETEPVYSPTNQECVRQLSSSTTIQQIAAMHGMPISAQYAIAVSRILQAFYETNDPESSLSQTDNKQNQSARRASHKKGHASRKDNNNDATASSSSMPAIDAFEMTVKSASQIITDLLAKEFNPMQSLIKAELKFELANLKLMMWSWEGAIQAAKEVIQQIEEIAKDLNQIPQSISDRPLYLPTGLSTLSTAIIGKAAFNIHDLATAEQFGSPYIKSLVMIHKADTESAAILLSQIALSKPVTAFYREHILSCGQLATLFCFNKKLVEVCASKLPHNLRNKLQPNLLIDSICNDVMKFYTDQLGMSSTTNKFIRGTHLIVRLMLLSAVVQANYGNPGNSAAIIQNAIETMKTNCPFIHHGLNFLLTANSAAVQMKSFMSQYPTCIQFWNQPLNPLAVDPMSKYPLETVKSIQGLLMTLFKSNPDCVVHPMSNQCSLDLCLLTGLINDDEKRAEQTFATLKMSTSVRSAARFIQSIIQTTPDTVPPASCPVKLLNDNKDTTLRGLAAAYYSHVIELFLPIFDTTILEERTQFFFRCFEEQCASFKVDTHFAAQPDQGEITGQWYFISANVAKTENTMTSDNQTMATRTNVSIPSATRTIAQMTTASNTATESSSRKKGGQSFRGNVFFFMGIVVDASINKGSLVPFILAGQPNELRTICDELSGIGLEMDEAKRGEQSDKGEQEKDADKDKKNKKNQKMKIETSSTTSKENVNIHLKDAENKWMMTIHKVQAALSKSSRIISSISSQGGTRWPSEMHPSNLDMAVSSSLSRMFNSQFGIYEKVQPITDWLYSEISPAKSQPSAKQ
ncbi:hypothetical protein TVAG_363810 [Trichomonas vaginalis G3]|uniref:Uncharacterized protein n=1 Tax=Trichomonas vaginalis (strain ATCC PRA-98 / G3) TaxID=412133 RepID=A2EDV0_TRIV3|nr:cilia- and flagella-associated protein 54 family [Trichomonas vaginalis G3]EAY09166.1 hypothetical protein TVAG_363810 [Trichomonas vaginalis G3]KAI5487046.1 cilia- and flagella-associated protein 54 family [Trichomonas vaginalis G3]|eukprot:XP_001321389.1 hypothetical protein [Trichomonas vaginalis G3]